MLSFVAKVKKKLQISVELILVNLSEELTENCEKIISSTTTNFE